MSELGLLREVGAEGGPSDTELDAARSRAHERLLAAIGREQRSERRTARPGRALAVRPALLTGAAAALAVVVGAAAAISALRPPAATARLDRLAVVAEGAQQPAPTGGGFVYARSQVDTVVQQVGPNGDVITFVSHQRIERWRDASGRLRVRTTFDEPSFPSAEDRAAYAAAGLAADYGAGVVEETDFEPAQLPVTARRWSTDPDVLRDEMLQEFDSAGDTEVARPARLLELGAALLASPGAEAGLRAAVMRVLAAEDGIETAPATTRAGAPGLAVMVEYEEAGSSFERRLVFDEATAQLVEQRFVALDDQPGGLPAGTVLRIQVNEPSVAVPSLAPPAAPTSPATTDG